jgi:maleate cis-trans isomerase
MSVTGSQSATTVGLLYPGFSAEDDFPALEARLGGAVRLPLVHTSVGEDAHRVDALLDLGSTKRLADGAAELKPFDPDAVMWACTSGSFVFGWDGARDQVRGVADVLGLPTSSTSIAFVEALAALGLERVAVAASYPHDVAVHFVEFLRRGGAEVVAFGSHDIYTAAEVGLLSKEQVVEMVRGGDSEQAQAVLVPDTAMHSLLWLDDLEEAVGKPVLTANQVTVWEGLRIAGGPTRFDGLGTLFR